MMIIMWRTTLLFLFGFGLLTGCGDDEPSGGGGSGAGGSGAGGSNEEACAPDDVLAQLDDFLTKFEASASGVAGHGGQFEATGFYLAPGLPMPPAIPAEFFSIFMGCTRAAVFEPACVMGRCTQLECTGRGGGWSNHYTLDGAVTADGFGFELLDIDHHWADGADGTTLDYALVATGPQDRAWDATGSAVMGAESASLELTFAELFGEEAVLTFAASPSSHEGSIAIGDVTIAATNADGALEATGDCP
jgi:hypothetical protein